MVRQWFLRYVQVTREKQIFNFIKMKNIWVSKDAMKKQPTKWKKIFANYISCKGFVYRIYKELTQLHNKQITQFKNRQRISIDIIQRCTNGK